MKGTAARMGVMKRVSLVFKAKANRALDKMEDPRETLDYSYQRQLELLTKVRRGVADVATSRKRVELQMNQIQQQANKLQDQARKALSMGREDLAREALGRKSSAQSQLDELQTQYAQLQGEEEKLTLASQRLQSKVDAFRTRKETIKATYTAAEAQTRINEAFSGISEEMGDVGMAIQRAEDKTAQMQARAGAIDELMASGALDDAVGGRRDDIQSELDMMSASSDVERELAMLKGEITASAPKQLEGGAQNGAGQGTQGTRHPSSRSRSKDRTRRRRLPSTPRRSSPSRMSKPSNLSSPSPPACPSPTCPVCRTSRRMVTDRDCQDPRRGPVPGRRRGHRRAQPARRRP
jgi:phage shock protein A